MKMLHMYIPARIAYNKNQCGRMKYHRNFCYCHHCQTFVKNSAFNLFPTILDLLAFPIYMYKYIAVQPSANELHA